MAEKDTKGLEKYLTQEAEKQQGLERSREQVRLELETRARGAIEKFEQKSGQLEPVAREQVSTIVQPWFDELVAKGTYSQLLTWIENHDGPSLSVSAPIYYYWPRKAFKGFRKSGGSEKEPFEWDAEYVVKNYKDFQQGVQEHQRGVDEVWTASFHIENERGFQGLLISQWPTIGAGFGFAVVGAKDLEIPVYVEDIAAAIPSIHPEVWIGFAKQIENGEALQVLEDSLKPKSVKVVSGDVYRTQQAQRRAEYLRLKREREAIR